MWAPLGSCLQCSRWDNRYWFHSYFCDPEAKDVACPFWRDWWDRVSVCSHSMGVLSGSFLLKTHVLLDLREIWLVLLFQYLPFCFLYSYSENSLIILASWGGQFYLNHLFHFLFISLSLYKDNLAFQNSVFKVVFPTRFYLFPCIFPLFFLFCLYVYMHKSTCV